MSGKLYYGTARRNINPVMPVSLAGYFNIRMWSKVIDDLEVRVLVLRQRTNYFALVQFDLVTVTQEMFIDLCHAVADLKILTPENMIVSATHSHTAPEVRATRPGFHPDYLPFIISQASSALREALDNLRAGELLSGITEDKRFSFNRRYWMKDGTVVTNPGKLNADIDRAEGEVDHDIPLIGIRSNGQLRVLLANIVNHTDTIGGNDVSADWTGVFVRTLQRELADGAMVMPLIGASGNINHFDVSTDSKQTCYAEAVRIGSGYAETVLKALPLLRPVKKVNMFTRQESVLCPSREISENELAEAKALLERYRDVPDVGPGINLTSEDLAQRKPVVMKYFARILTEIADSTVQPCFNLVGVFLGDCCILSLPCEPFVEIGQEIKKKLFPEFNAMVVSHSNGTGHEEIFGGYIPNSWNYGRGGYETTPRSSRVSVNTAGLLINAWRKIAKELEQTHLSDNVTQPLTIER